MPSSSAGILIRRWFEEVWNRRDTHQVAVLMAPDAVAYSVDETGTDLHGPAAFQVFLQRFFDNLADIHFTLHEVIEAGPMAAARWSARLRHTGDGLGVAASGTQLALSGMTMIRVADGMIAEGWNEWDQMALATGIGLLMAPTGWSANGVIALTPGLHEGRLSFF